MSDPDLTQRGELPRRLRESASQERSELLLAAAKEIERLHTVLDSYCASAAAACREIAALRAKQ